MCLRARGPRQGDDRPVYILWKYGNFALQHFQFTSMNYRFATGPLLITVHGRSFDSSNHRLMRYCVPGTIYLMLSSLQRTFEFKDKDHTVKEDVGTDVKQSYVQYHIKNEDSEVWVINDFNRVCKLVYLLLWSAENSWHGFCKLYFLLERNTILLGVFSLTS